MSRALKEGQNPKQSLGHNPLVPIDLSRNSRLATFHKTKNGNLEGLCLDLSKVNEEGIHESYQNHMEESNSLL